MCTRAESVSFVPWAVGYVRPRLKQLSLQLLANRMVNHYLCIKIYLSELIFLIGNRSSTNSLSSSFLGLSSCRFIKWKRIIINERLTGQLSDYYSLFSAK